jgi:tetratricopeptide (TPR) repeat protein
MTIGAALVLLGTILFIAHRSGMISAGTSSMEARGDYWRGAVAIARDHPWLGTGPGTFGSIYPKYKTAQTEEAQLVHNNFLQMWPDSGLAAFVIFGMMWVVALKDSFQLISQRRGDAAAIAVCAALTGWVVHGLVDFDLYVPGVAFPAFLLLGILQGLKELPSVKPVADRDRGHRVIGTLCAAMAGVVIWMEGASLVATYRHDQAYALMHANPSAALDEARSATRLAPFNAPYQATAGDLAVRLRLFDEATEHYRAAIEDDPYRASYHWRLARAEMAARGPDAIVLQQLRLAASLNPTNQRYNQELADAEESVRQSPGSLLESAPAKE